MKLLIALLLTSSIQYGQGLITDFAKDSVYSFKLPPLFIENYVNNRTNHYNYDNYPSKIKLTSEILLIEHNSKIDSFDAALIRTIGIQHGNQSFKAGLYTGLAGSAIHFEDKLRTLAYFTLSGGLTGGLLGAIVGAFRPDYDVYTDLSFENVTKKHQLINIFKKYHKL
jgi:hypothetical protein